MKIFRNLINKATRAPNIRGHFGPIMKDMADTQVDITSSVLQSHYDEIGCAYSGLKDEWAHLSRLTICMMIPYGHHLRSSSDQQYNCLFELALDVANTTKYNTPYYEKEVSRYYAYKHMCTSMQNMIGTYHFGNPVERYTNILSMLAAEQANEIKDYPFPYARYVDIFAKNVDAALRGVNSLY